MKVLILSDSNSNNGPANVHKEFINNWPIEDSISCIECRNKILFVILGFFKGIFSDVLISPCMNFPQILLHHLFYRLNKAIVCFCHGYVAYENEINHLGHGSFLLNCYRKCLDNSEIVVTNSALQTKFILNYQPELGKKITNITLGINAFNQMDWIPPVNSIKVAVSGGSREIKGNDIVVSACRRLRQQGINVDLNVYGEVDDNNELLTLDNKLHIEFHGQVDRSCFLQELSKSTVFVMNSRHEPFGLSALDALEAGCSILLSKNCGVIEIVNVEDCDVINNCEDADEVERKIQYLIDHPNGLRLYKSIDFERNCWNEQVRKLRNICFNAFSRKNN